MDTTSSIPRHKTAIRRESFSLPLKCAFRDRLVQEGASVFDYGCGKGQDIELLKAEGINCNGWDPAFRPDAHVSQADIVNLGYVINVIESAEERRTALHQAWQLCRHVLVVAAQVKVPGRGKEQVEFGDGILTTRGTFQKYFGQGELRDFLQSELGTEAIPAAIGVFYIFRDEAAKQQFLANRYRRRSTTPRRRLSELRFEAHRELLESLMGTILQLGRLPYPDEFPQAGEVAEKLGSLKRAFALIRRVTGDTEWEANQQRRAEDLLVYLALARFGKRPPISKLPIGLQWDIRAFYGSYTKGCRLADELLFRAGRAEAIDEACRRSTVGKLLPNALYVHRDGLEALEPLLRVYEGCGQAYLGEVEGANVIKLHRYSGKLSYLVYPNFETEPHPALLRSVKVSLRTLQIDCYDYMGDANPPILHRKEAFLNPDHPLYGKFARLTQQEERHGLLDETATIGTRQGWVTRLQQAGLKLCGHRLVRTPG